MPAYTFPNQRIINIHRIKPESDFLGIQNANWMAAAKDLRAQALLLYLYLASNANNYTLALSPADIQEKIGMPRSTFYDQFQKLVEKGYLVYSHGNTFEFYEIPQAVQDEEVRTAFVQGNKKYTDSDNAFTEAVQDCAQFNIETNNKYSQTDNYTNNQPFVRKEFVF